jgi:glutaredoxin-related protein
MKHCALCKLAKEKLEKEGLEFKEIDVMESAENVGLAKKYNIKMGGTIIDDETGKEIKL